MALKEGSDKVLKNDFVEYLSGLRSYKYMYFDWLKYQNKFIENPVKIRGLNKKLYFHLQKSHILSNK